jgi:hypothetical protein
MASEFCVPERHRRSLGDWHRPLDNAQVLVAGGPMTTLIRDIAIVAILELGAVTLGVVAYLLRVAL